MWSKKINNLVCSARLAKAIKQNASGREILKTKGKEGKTPLSKDKRLKIQNLKIRYLKKCNENQMILEEIFKTKA